MNKGFTVWFTGLPGVGKTTIAHLLEKKLKECDRNVEMLNDDIVKANLYRGLIVNKRGCNTAIQRIAFVCKLLTRNGVVVISDVISPYRKARDKARKEIGNFIEVYVKCLPEVCVERDVTGFHKKMSGSTTQGFVEVSNFYEEPPNPDLIIETDKEAGEESVHKIVKKIIELGYLGTKELSRYVYSSEEEEKIKERLTRLGYL
jgi:adenylyl-sulfate kinase